MKLPTGASVRYSEAERSKTHRAAFYALRPGAWRDYITLLHAPYTAWHLSYVVLGVALSPDVRLDRMGATLLAFFLAVGISSHALDELSGRPLTTAIPARILAGLAAVSLAGAIAIGAVGVVVVSVWLVPFIAFGAFIAPAYNLERFRGRFHSDFWFAISWGAFPFLTAYWASAERFDSSALFGAAAVVGISLGQRVLSSRVRRLRRKAHSVEGRVLYHDGVVEDIDTAWVVKADEKALSLLAAAMVAISVAALLASV